MLQLKELTEINSVCGNEHAVRNKLKEMVSPYATEVTVDSMGNLIAFKKGLKPGGKKVVISAHMDEVGFIVTDINDDGYIKFSSVGSVDPRIMLAQRVVIGDDKVPGVMGVKAVHLQTADERQKVIQYKNMYIDIGASSKDDASSKVHRGDYIAFDSSYREFGDGMVKAKALDDRVGCAIMAELIKYDYENDIYFAFTTQEEIGVRGATIVAKRVKPEIAIMLESTTCADTAGSEPHEYVTEIGKGSAISLMDRSGHSDRELNSFITNLAEEKQIEYQYKKSGMGGNETRAYQTSALPCRTAAISLPTRYLHSPVSSAKLSDIEKMYDLLKAICENIHRFEI